MTIDATQYQREINDASAEYQQQRQRTLTQQYPARYYHLLGEEGQLEATLIVVLDTQGRAMQGILRYDPMLPLTIQNKLKRRAENELSARFLGSGPSTTLYVYESGRPLENVDIVHTGEDVEEPAGTVNLVYIAGAILAMFLVVGLLFWLLNSLFRGRQEVVIPTATPLAIAETANMAAAAVAPAAAVTPTPDVNAPGIQTNDLPGSKLASPAIGVGKTVKIRQGLRSFVRSQPGSDQGDVVGYLQDGDTAVVIGGPTWLPGDSDTIVWWYVDLPDGLRGWTPANTSQFTLLDVAQ